MICIPIRKNKIKLLLKKHPMNMKKIIFLSLIATFVCLVSLSAQNEIFNQDSILIETVSNDSISNSNSNTNSNEKALEVSILNDLSKDNIKDDWNLFGWVSFIIALISAIFAIITWREQKETEKHTRKAPISVQLGKMKDLSRHFYRNLICTSACILRFRHKNNIDYEGNKKFYPSESNLLKLQTLPDDVVLDIDTDNSYYGQLHELKLLLRNYNVEIEVASEHLSRNNIKDKSLEQDFDNLIFKPLHLIKEAMDVEIGLSKSEKNKHAIVLRGLCDMIIEHFNKLRIKSNFDLLSNNREDISPSECLQQLLEEDDKGNVIGYNKIIDTKKGLERSFQNIIKKLESGKTEWLKIDKSDNDINVTIIKNGCLKHLKDYITTENFTEAKELCDFIDEITSSPTNDNISKFCSKPELNDSFNYPELRYYFKYLSEAQWDYFKLLNYMIAIDTIIETNRIGMVNY